MLAERVTEWTQQWKQEGFEEGLERLRTVLLREIEGRFGALPESLRGKLAALDSIEEIARLIARVATAPSLAELKL